MNAYQPMINLICSALTKLPESVDTPTIEFRLELTERGVWLKVTDDLSGCVFGRKGRTLVEAWLSVVAYAEAVQELYLQHDPLPGAGGLVDAEAVAAKESARFRLAKDVLWCRSQVQWHLDGLDRLVLDRQSDLGVARDFTPYLVREAEDAAERTE